jgi:queuine tRNA-ribosyltransferase
MKFTLQDSDPFSHARTGILHTDHGAIPTPVFMPVGTGATVKGIHQRELRDDVKAAIILGNTYHLALRPGTDIIGQAGGIHRFMQWDGAVLTDSGGYQVFSLADQRKITPEGAEFRSHIDGSKHVFTPENVVDIQRILGADIMMALDECTPYPCEFEYARNSMNLTHEWLERGKKRFQATGPAYGYQQDWFPIVQGSTFPDLRRESAKRIAEAGMDGNAIGGLSVGEPTEMMYEMVEIVTEILPPEKPRYLMGVGTPANLLESVARGIDMFDCVMPTRNGRNGQIFTREGIINIRNEKWKDDFSPIDPSGDCYADQQYSRAYLRHLIISGELLGAQVASLHNLRFYLWLMEETRAKIRAGTFHKWKNEMIPKLSVRL